MQVASFKRALGQKIAYRLRSAATNSAFLISPFLPHSTLFFPNHHEQRIVL